MQSPRGLHIRLHASGSFVRIAETSPPRPLNMTAALGLAPGSSAREQVMAITGALDAHGLADDVPITGTVRLSDWRHPRLDYALTFTNNQGDPLQLVGSERLTLGSLVRARLALHAEIREPQGKFVARCQMLARVRPTWR